MVFTVQSLICSPGVAGGAGIRPGDAIVLTGERDRPLTRTHSMLGGRPVRRHRAQPAGGGPNAPAAASDAVLAAS
jgi:hypothetical protein